MDITIHAVRGGEGYLVEYKKEAYLINLVTKGNAGPADPNKFLRFGYFEDPTPEELAKQPEVEAQLKAYIETQK